MIKLLSDRKTLLKMVLLMAVFVASLEPLHNPDTFFHIKDGQYIFYNWIPQFDPYTLHQGFKYIYHEWLSDIIFFFVYSIYGFTALWMFKIIITFLLFALIYKVAKFLSNNSTISFITSAFSMLVLYDYTVIRPQAFSFIIILIEIYLLEKFEATKEKKYLYFLPLTSLILANMHGGVLLVFLAILAFYLALWILGTYVSKNISNIQLDKKTWLFTIMISLVTFLVMFINPQTYDTVFYFLRLNSSELTNVSELQHLYVIGISGISAAIAASLVFIFIIYCDRSLTIKQTAFIFGTFCLGILYGRFISYFALFAGVFFAQYLSQSFTKEFMEKERYQKTLALLNKYRVFTTGILCFSFVFLIFTVMVIGFKPIRYELYPTGAIDILKKVPDLRIYNDYNTGHYLIFSDIKVFIDGRAEMYTRGFNNTDVFNDYISTLYGKVNPEDTFKKYNLNYYLVYKSMAVGIYLAGNDNYELLYEGPVYALYKRK